MKKVLLFVCVAMIALSLFPRTVAFADTTEKSNRYTVTYYDGVASSSGYYFGQSGISVTTVVRDDGFKQGLTDADAEKMFAEIDELMATLDALSDTQTVGSDIYNFNHSATGETIVIHKYTYEMLNIAHKMYTVTNGAFNPAVYRLVDLWGFSSRTYHADGNLPYDRKWQDQDGNGTKESYPLPDQKYIDAFRRLTDFDGVEVFEKDGQYFVKKTCPDVTVDGVNYSQWIDLGGIAKGYAADLADDIIVKYGYDKGYVNVGTSSFTFLQYSDEKGWALDLQDPFNGWSSYASLEISDAVLSTSGQYVRKYTTDGVEYSHIIDASTGRPAQTGIVTVTTIGGSAAEDDCLTTALTVMGLDKAVEFINGDYFAENKLDVSLVYDGGMSVKHMITNIETSRFVTYGTNQIQLSSKFTEDGKVYVSFSNIKHLGDKDAVIGIIVSIAVIFVIVAVTVSVRKGRTLTTAQRVASVAKSKTFKFADIIVYGALTVLIAVMFIVFVIGDSTKGELERFYITDDATGKIIYSFDFKNYGTSDYLGDINSYWENGSVTVNRIADKVYVTVRRNDIEGDHYNIVKAEKTDTGFKVTVIEATCSNYADCVHSFFPITTSNRSIVCIPHRITVVGYNSNDRDDVIII